MSTTENTAHPVGTERAERTARLRALAEEASDRFAALEDELAPDALAEAVSAWATMAASVPARSRSSSACPSGSRCSASPSGTHCTRM